MRAAGKRPDNLAQLARLHSDPEYIANRNARLARIDASPEHKTRLADLNSDPEMIAKRDARLARSLASPEQKEPSLVRANSRWSAAKAAGCKTLAEYAALLKSQSAKV